MTLAICFFLYFAPPIASLFVGPSMAMFGRVWLFRIAWILFWPILLFLIPWRTYP
jgi:hypothetical protein